MTHTGSALPFSPLACPVTLTPDAIPPPFGGEGELSVEGLIGQVPARNPSLAQTIAAWQAASARFPQVTFLDDPMFRTIGPGTRA